MTWLSENLPTVISVATAGAGALVAAVRALWVALVTAPKLEAAAREVVLRQENDELQTRLEQREAEIRALNLELIAQYKLSLKLQRKSDGNSTPPST